MLYKHQIIGIVDSYGRSMRILKRIMHLTVVVSLIVCYEK